MAKNTLQLMRVLDTDVDGTLSVNRALAKVKGIGFMLSNTLVKVAGFEHKKASDLTKEDLNKLKEIIDNPSKYGIPSWMLNRRKDPEEGDDKHLITTNLALRKDFDIKILKKIKAYRGMRHSAGLPVRGQSTKAHFREGKSVGVQKKSIKPSGKK